MKKILKLLIFSLIMSTIVGCGKEKYYNGEINVLNWSSYISYDIINDFSREYNIKVNYGTYSSNEELLAKLSSSNPGTYDLVFPSDYMVDIMKARDLIEKIEKNKITNFNNINPKFLNPKFDINNDYSIPFLAATNVIAINRDKIKDKITSYNDLLDPKYKNNIILLEDQRIVIGMALQALGYDMNEVDEAKLLEAKNWLLELGKNVKAFDSDSPKTFLITDEVDIGVIWNAEATIAKEEKDNIEIIYPLDGFAISLDNYCIVKKAKNKENIYKFINYLLRPDISKRITDEYPYINTNLYATNLSNDEIDKIINNGTYVKNIGNKISSYDKIWAEIK